MKKFNIYLQESSLSRLWRHNEKHDCGAMTAFRNAEGGGFGERYSNADNKKRNRSLLAKLKSKGYYVQNRTKLKDFGGFRVEEESGRTPLTCPES